MIELYRRHCLHVINWMLLLGVAFVIEGCNPTVDGGNVLVFYPEECAVSVGVEGGEARVRFAEYLGPFVLVTERVDCMHLYNGMDSFLTYWYGFEPREWEFSEKDVVNLIPGYSSEAGLTEETEEMRESGATVLTCAESVDYGWMRADVTEKEVTVRVEKNDTGEERVVAIVFYCHPSHFNNVLVVEQAGE